MHQKAYTDFVYFYILCLLLYGIKANLRHAKFSHKDKVNIFLMKKIYLIVSVQFYIAVFLKLHWGSCAYDKSSNTKAEMTPIASNEIELVIRSPLKIEYPLQRWLPRKHLQMKRLDCLNKQHSYGSGYPINRLVSESVPSGRSLGWGHRQDPYEQPPL